MKFSLIRSLQNTCFRRTPLWRLRLALFVVLLCTAQHSTAEKLVIIVNPSLPVDQLSKHDVVNIFMGRQKKLGDNQLALPIDLAGTEDSSVRAEFYRQLLNRDLAEINSYWARLIFSGKNSPPTKMETSAEILDVVAQNPAAIAYLPVSQVNGNVKVVFTLAD